MAKKQYPNDLEILILAALCHLGDEAYGLRVRRSIQERTGYDIPIGTVYANLHRLQRRGWVRSYLGEPTAERGGRAKRYFQVERDGARALKEAISTFAAMTEGLVLS